MLNNFFGLISDFGNYSPFNPKIWNVGQINKSRVLEKEEIL